MHARYGGPRQEGISPSSSTPNILVFSDPASGEQHGYFDRWEGAIYRYCGAGQRGDQALDGRNGALLRHRDDGRSIRLFQGTGGEVMYVGEFEVDAGRPYEEARAPETGGGPLRKTIHFRLHPVGEFWAEGAVQQRTLLAPTLRTPYRRAEESPVTQPRRPFEIDPDAVDRTLGTHAMLQNLLADAARDADRTVVSPGLGDPPFDMGWWDGEEFVVCEVKSLPRGSEVGQLRLGLGQVLDYADQLRRVDRKVRPVLFVERAPPDPRWPEICERAGVVLGWPDKVAEAVSLTDLRSRRFPTE